MIHSIVKKHLDGYWLWLVSREERSYVITGKHLFFSPDKNKLIEIAVNEIENHGFHKAKVNMTLLKGQTDYVLCLYYKDDSRKYELAERNRQEYKVQYRYWKSDAATRKGQYSGEFLERLSEPYKQYFTKNKLPPDG